MNTTVFRLSFLAFGLWAVGSVACSAASTNRFTASSSGGPGSGASGTGSATGGSSSSAGVGGSFTTTTSTSASAGTGGTGVTYAYAHTNTDLYKFDPSQSSISMTYVGSFSCIGGGGDSSMTDLAVDSQGDLWGVSAHNAYHLTIGGGSTVTCDKIIPLQGVPATFYALSFVPKNVIDTNSETLLAGDTAGDLWRIDQTSGALEQHGNFGNVPPADPQGHAYPSDPGVSGTVGTPWQLSGDIVFLSDMTNGGMPVGFATLRDCSGSTCSTTDSLVEIDTTKLGKAGTAVTTNVTLKLRGQILKSSKCTDTQNSTYGKMFGIAAWNSTIYGFSHSSYIVEISNVDGSACAISGSNTNQVWSGAAVTTIAPVIPPPVM